ncbi:histidinol-phosphate transaminase [Compostibacter hankyongensis]|uniref:Histidinol-phosphate aminotransferase n=1 Tax=Compostibacter hankyongensis TaxID=1007089 RepID=A0ABP8FXA4_9BACT
MFDLNKLLRDNIKKLVPYSSARDEFQGEASVYLDANENSFGSPLSQAYNRYPDPLQIKLKEKVAGIKGITPPHIFLGNGSDECIDILYRAFCHPGRDNVVICPPTYGMYEVSAHINDVEVRNVPLTLDYQLDLPGIEAAVDGHTRLIFLCSPNNPTGNALRREDVELVLNNFPGVVVIDEAYINFSKYRSFIQELPEYPNLVVLQTLSKAWGLAALRIGMAFASPELVAVFNRIKPPYNINQASQELALAALGQVEQVNRWIRETVHARQQLKTQLEKLSIVEKVYPSEANFLLVKTTDPAGIYGFLVRDGIIVRDRSRVELCEGCLRITIGTPAENEKLLAALNDYQRLKMKGE